MVNRKRESNGFMFAVVAAIGVLALLGLGRPATPDQIPLRQLTASKQGARQVIHI